MQEGTVVIVTTGQCGTIVATSPYGVVVLLRNGEMWQGPLSQVHEPQTQAEMDSAPIEIERSEKKKRRRHEAD